jgi:hypothetical protein
MLAATVVVHSLPDGNFRGAGGFAFAGPAAADLALCGELVYRGCGGLAPTVGGTYHGRGSGRCLPLDDAAYGAVGRSLTA